MSPRLLLSRAVLSALGLGSALASATDDRAGASADICPRAYVETQRLQRAARFRAARQQALSCSQDACSETVRAHCSEWLESIERAMPTLTIEARDDAGAALAEVRVEANGELLAERLNGRALELDPGEYVLAFRHGEQVVEQRTLIREAEKYRTLHVQFAGAAEPHAPGLAAEPASAAAYLASATSTVATRGASAPADPALASPPLVRAPSESASAVGDERHDRDDTAGAIPMASYVFGGVGAAALMSFAVIGTTAYASEQGLQESCAGACAQSKVDAVRARYLVADVALGVAVSSFAVAAAIWIWTPTPRASAASTPRADAARAASGSVQLAVGPRGVFVNGEF